MKQLKQNYCLYLSTDLIRKKERKQKKIVEKIVMYNNVIILLENYYYTIKLESASKAESLEVTLAKLSCTLRSLNVYLLV